MIEGLLEDKKKLYEKLEEFKNRIKDTDSQKEKIKKLYEEKLNIELKKNKEAWIASEKVRKDKWEKEKI
jgi:hypothetical protein